MTSGSFGSQFSTDLSNETKPRRKTVWLFEMRGRTAPRRRFGGYLLISALGVIGALVLLVLSAELHAYAAALRMSALGWFVVFGAFRLTLFRRLN